MGNLTVHGNLRELKGKLGRMQSVIRYRVSYGYRKFQHDEEWRYKTMEDVKVCKEFCAPLHGNVYRGDYVIATFQYAVSVDTKKVKANQHRHCRCDIDWINMHVVLVQRLHEELVEAAA